MSMGKLDYATTLTTHRIAPILLIGSMSAAIYLLVVLP